MEETKNTLGEVTTSPPETETDIKAKNQSAALDNATSVMVVDRDQDGMAESSLDMALGRLASPDAKRNGVQVVLQIAAAWARETSSNTTNLVNKNSKLAEENAAKSVEIAALQAANSVREKHRYLVNSALILGPVIFTYGLDQLTAEKLGVGIAALVIGGCITIAALFAQRKDTDV